MCNGEYKNIMKKIVMMIMVVALIALPTMAQDWQSTSSMTGSGSAYGAQVTAVGAVEVTDMATTTESYSPAKAPGVRKNPATPGSPSTPGQGEAENQFPLGDAVLPLMLLLGVYCSILVIRRNKHAKELKS